MADPVLRPLVDRGLPPGLTQLQQTGDGSTTPGGGVRQARQMTGMQDASTAGGLKDDAPSKYAAAGIPDPLRSLINRAMDDNDDAQVM